MSDPLDGILERVRALGALPEEIASAAAPKVQDALRKTAAAGTSPSGKAWAPRKADGKRALANAAAAVTARAVGPTVQVRLEGTSTGDAKVQAIQNVKRPIIPATGEAIPGVVLEAIREGADEAFDRIVGGR